MGCHISFPDVEDPRHPLKEDSKTHLDSDDEHTEISFQHHYGGMAKKAGGCNHTAVIDDGRSCQLCRVPTIREEKVQMRRIMDAFPEETKCGAHCRPCHMISSGLCCVHADQWVIETEGKVGGLRIRFCSHCRDRRRQPAVTLTSEEKAKPAQPEEAKERHPYKSAEPTTPNNCTATSRSMSYET